MSRYSFKYYIMYCTKDLCIFLYLTTYCITYLRTVFFYLQFPIGLNSSKCRLCLLASRLLTTPFCHPLSSWGPQPLAAPASVLEPVEVKFVGICLPAISHSACKEWVALYILSFAFFCDLTTYFYHGLLVSNIKDNGSCSNPRLNKGTLNIRHNHILTVLLKLDIIRRNLLSYVAM
jgi:hypothetical protein